MSKVTFRKAVKRYGAFTALQPLDLDIREGEFLTLLGPSGCGKTTTLRLVAGFIQPTEGHVYIGDEDVTGKPPQHRGIGMVFQDYALFPHMTIAENIGFALKERGASAGEIRTRVWDLLQLVKLPDVEKRYPSELSGGQQQRVAVARAVAHAPRVLLMDEPLGALDLKLREAMQSELRNIQKRLGITTIYVTHDQTEAMNMSDRIAVMNHGVMEQIGSAEDVYNRPRTRFVADFIGQINLLPVETPVDDNGLAVTRFGETPIRVAQVGDRTLPTAGTLLGIRPEQLSIAAAGGLPNGVNRLAGTIVGARFAGNVIKVEVGVAQGRTLLVDSHPDVAGLEPGNRIDVVWKPENGILLEE
ncbi:MAG: ABC transporter ATP-binding protein [Pseudomonadota bacterium]|nr:ABC transporter ATP-binding protein [Pseudomonadota bacterium]